MDLGNLNWDAISAIGSIITLLYLAIQVRQNTKSIRSSTVHAIHSSDFFNLVSENSNLASIFRRGMNGDKLDEEEEIQFQFLMMKGVLLFEDMYYQKKNNTLGDKFWSRNHWFWNRLDILLEWYAGCKGFTEWWEKNEKFYDTGFSKHVNNAIHKVESSNRITSRNCLFCNTDKVG